LIASQRIHPTFDSRHPCSFDLCKVSTGVRGILPSGDHSTPSSARLINPTREEFHRGGLLIATHHTLSLHAENTRVFRTRTGKQLMPSILARLRTRVVSDSSRQSLQPVLPPPPTTTTTTVTTPTAIEQLEPTHQPPLEEGSAPVTRKIYPDLDLLPDDLAAQPTPIRHGLPPPVRRGSSGLPTTITRPPPLQRPSMSSAPSTTTGDADSPKASHSSGSSSHTTPSGGGGSGGGGGFMERLGNWSTFGRRHAPPPSLNEFGEPISPSPSAWHTRRANSRPSSRPSSKITTSTHSSPYENKENTPRLSSQSSSDRRTPAATAASARSNSYKRQQQQPNISTPVARELGFDSPRTLGHPSPQVAAPSIPPPLPPLDHSTLRSHSRSWIATFPPRARSAGPKNNNDEDDDEDNNNKGGAQGHFTFGKSLRPYRSLPRVQHIFRTRSNNKSVDESNEQGGDEGRTEDAEVGGEPEVPVPTIASWPSTRPINDLSQSPGPPTHLSPSSSSSSSSSNTTPLSIPVGNVDAHDPIAPNLYDPNISLFGNVVRMQQDAPRVRDKKPLRSSLKASTRPSPLPIASSSSSNTDTAALMPSFSLVAAAATASDSAPPHTPVQSPTRTENAKAKGKRKAEDVDITPPDSKKATFAVPGVCPTFLFFPSTSAW
jgi:hypothetical protein